MFPTYLLSRRLYLQVDSYEVWVGEDLGDIVLVKIEKKKYWVHDDWYCRYITVKTPTGDYLEFPCFRWLVDDNEVVLRDGRGGAIVRGFCKKKTKKNPPNKPKKERLTNSAPSLTPSCVCCSFSASG